MIACDIIASFYIFSLLKYDRIFGKSLEHDTYETLNFPFPYILQISENSILRHCHAIYGNPQACNQLLPMFYKTTEYLRMKGVLDSIELWMLRRADYMRERNILGESHNCSYKTLPVFHFWQEIGWAGSLLSLAFAARWNPKDPSYVSTRLFRNSILQLCCGEQTIWNVQSYWQMKYQTNTYLGKKLYIYFRFVNNFIYKPGTS